MKFFMKTHVQGVSNRAEGRSLHMRCEVEGEVGGEIGESGGESGKMLCQRKVDSTRRGSVRGTGFIVSPLPYPKSPSSSVSSSHPFYYQPLCSHPILYNKPTPAMPSHPKTMSEEKRKNREEAGYGVSHLPLGL
jgi:hypothetical protein